MLRLARDVFAVGLALVSICASTTRAQCSAWTHDFPLAGADQAASAMAVFDDGSGPALFVAGDFGTIGGIVASRVAKWNGSTWSTLGTGTNGIVFALAVYDDGHGPALYAGGRFSMAGTTPVNNIARWDGQAWSPLGSGIGYLEVFALTVFDDGSGPALFAAGYFDSAGGQYANGLASWNGTSWTGFHPMFNGYPGIPEVLAVYDDGSGTALYVAGTSVDSTNHVIGAIERWNGAQFTEIGNSGNAGVFALAVYDSGAGLELVAGGSFTSMNGVSVRGLAAWNGSVWRDLGGGVGPPGYFLDEVDALGVFDDGAGPALFVSGQFDLAGGIPAQNIARWNGQAWSDVGGADERSNCFVAYDDGTGAALYTGGYFTRTGNAFTNRVARWNGTTWSGVGFANAPNGTVSALRVHDDGSGPALYVGGNFSAAGNQLANSIAEFDGTHLTPVGNGLVAWGSNVPAVNDLAPFDDGTGTQLYACGAFIDPSPGGTQVRHVARWNGSAWSLLPGGDVDGPAYALAVYDAGSGPELYVGGSFTHAGATSVHHIARWNGRAWFDVGGGVANALYAPAVGVHALCVGDDGHGTALFVGGQFDTVAGQHSGYIAKWNGTSWSTLAGGLDGPNPSTMVRSLVAWNDGTGPAIFAAGNFLGASGGAVPAVFLGKWNGSAWSTLRNGVNAEAHSLCVFDDGTGNGSALYVGGPFTDAGGNYAFRIARWDGANWSALAGGVGPNYGATVEAIAAFGGDLYAGGTFLQADGHPSFDLARFGGCGQTGQLFCFGDGSATPCPCGNASAAGDRVGCLNSQGVGASLRASGEPSLAHDSLVLHGAQMPNGSALYFQGTNEQNGGAGTMFGDGLRCAGGSVLRLMTKTPSGGMSQYPDAGDPPVSVRGLVPSPATRTYQIRYRNAASFCTSAAFNLSNGVEIVWNL